MLNEPTIEKLAALRLHAFAAAWTEQQKNPEVAKLSFDERLGLLVDAEWLHRENARMERYTRDAKLRISSACIEDIDFSAKRELDKSVIRQLATGRWVQEHHSIVITGSTGVDGGQSPSKFDGRGRSGCASGRSTAPRAPALAPRVHLDETRRPGA